MADLVGDQRGLFGRLKTGKRRDRPDLRLSERRRQGGHQRGALRRRPTGQAGHGRPQRQPEPLCRRRGFGGRATYGRQDNRGR